MAYDKAAQGRVSKTVGRLHVADMIEKHAPEGPVLLIAGPGAHEVPLYAGEREVVAVDTDWECLMDAHRHGATQLWHGRLSKLGGATDLAAAHIDLFCPPGPSMVRELTPFLADKPFKRGAVLAVTYVRARVLGVEGEENYKLMLRNLLRLMGVSISRELLYYSYNNGSTGNYPMATVIYKLR